MKFPGTPSGSSSRFTTPGYGSSPPPESPVGVQTITSRFYNELFSGRKSGSNYLLLSIPPHLLIHPFNSIPQSTPWYSTRNTRNNSLNPSQQGTNHHLSGYRLGGGERVGENVKYSPGTLVKTSVVLQFFPVHPDLYSGPTFPPEIPPSTGIILSQPHNGFIQWLIGDKTGWSNYSYMCKVHQWNLEQLFRFSIHTHIIPNTTNRMIHMENLGLFSRNYHVYLEAPPNSRFSSVIQSIHFQSTPWNKNEHHISPRNSGNQPRNSFQIQTIFLPTHQWKQSFTTFHHRVSIRGWYCSGM